ncbi:hypothetical protein HUT18_11870 [Streptomyces sp. NA04227]|uniref:hypothetical protein n=1 Tax=Streptomyces sp. NA04227 TaxID=2742136 RepID=UPI001590767F|nr:hypothetical protein [Streptomyces sp. NA04227]QKW06995.1 hypothetical protein HUT18_11870 [Streptomyces sp. NA04227]
MNPDYLPAIGQALREITAFTSRNDVTDATLAELEAELHRAHQLVKQAQGKRAPANRCTRHPGGPVEPGAENGCLLCGTAARRPAQPVPEGVEPGEVLRFLKARGHDAATARFGGRAVTRALAIGNRHPSNLRQGHPAPPHDPEGEPTR